MKKEYDFSNAERGKFYSENAVLNIPIYLESDIRKHFEKLASKKKTNIESIVNSVLRKNINLSKSIS